MQESQKQLRHTINYRNNDIEVSIYNFIEERAKNSVYRPQEIIKEIVLDYMKMVEKNK